MKYTVTWLPDPVETLAGIWTIAHDRNAITKATHQLESRLVSDPLDEGEERGETDRITFEFPLQIIFRVDVRQRIVLVTAVGLIGSRA